MIVQNEVNGNNDIKIETKLKWKNVGINERAAGIIYIIQ